MKNMIFFLIYFYTKFLHFLHQKKIIFCTKIFVFLPQKFSFFGPIFSDMKTKKIEEFCFSLIILYNCCFMLYRVFEFYSRLEFCISDMKESGDKIDLIYFF